MSDEAYPRSLIIVGNGILNPHLDVIVWVEDAIVWIGGKLWHVAVYKLETLTIESEETYVILSAKGTLGWGGVWQEWWLPYSIC